MKILIISITYQTRSIDSFQLAVILDMQMKGQRHILGHNNHKFEIGIQIILDIIFLLKYMQLYDSESDLIQ